MSSLITSFRLTWSIVGLLAVVSTTESLAQRATPAATGAFLDSGTVVAGAHFKAGGFHRAWFGGTYRDLWTMPIRVPILNLRTFAGGLRPVKLGGGHQTKSLHFVTADGVRYVFRPVDKDDVVVPEMWEGTLVKKLAMDAGSNAHPAGAIVAARLMDASGVLHVNPVLMLMPDDTLLGKYRKAFAGRLGAIEEDPAGPKADFPGFAGATHVIDSDSLLARINRDPAEQVDAAAFLTARLMDMLMNDWDRGPSQWKWARFTKHATSPWQPIPRDRDNALIAASGFFPKLASAPTHMGLEFGPTYGAMSNLTVNSILLDKRLLVGLERPVWDSVASTLMSRITDPVIDSAVQAMPREYQGTAPELIRKLRMRRDSLPAVARRFYAVLATVVDIHATDAADRATITRVDNDHVRVRLVAGDGATYFDRQFDAAETQEIRVYLHGGDDRATIVGDVARSISVKVIGGNGTNTLVDSSRVGGRSGAAELQDRGTVSDVHYGPDTLFNRRPLVDAPSGRVDPIRDYGARTGPIGGLTVNRDFGFTPRLGIARYAYAFNHYPYSSMMALEGRYSLKLSRYKIGLTTDSRLENSAVHYTTLTRMSKLELVNFHGYGNATPGADTAYYVARQRQLLFRPALAISLDGSTELALGPSIQYSTTDTARRHFVADSQPYGFGKNGAFGTAALRLSLHHDNRTPRRHAQEGTILDVAASYFPAVWDATGAFEVVEATGGYYFTPPIPLHPSVAIRAGVKKVFGDFPFQEAAFLGGSTSIRTLDPQRFAGDASVYGTLEVRVPVVKFTVILPLDIGVFGTVNYGEVFYKGSALGGLHNAYGGGFWIGFHELTADIRLMRADEIGRSVVSLRFTLPTTGRNQ